MVTTIVEVTPIRMMGLRDIPFEQCRSDRGRVMLPVVSLKEDDDFDAQLELFYHKDFPI